MTLKSLSFAQISLLGSKHMNQRFITCLYPDSPRISSDPTCPKLSSFSSPQKPVLTLLTSLHQWTIYHSSHFLCFGVISASYKHLHPPNPHWFNFLQFLDSMYMSTSLLQWWLRLFPVLTSLLCSLSSFLASPLVCPPLCSQSCLTGKYDDSFIYSTSIYGPGVDLGVWNTVPTFWEFRVYD